MPTFTFTSPEGKNYTVEGPDGATQDQAFQILQKQIGVPSAPQPITDKYAQSAQQDLAQMKSAGIPTQDGYARRILQGATFGGADEIMAGLETPQQMIQHGTFNPAEGYNYAKALEDAKMSEARKQQGALGTAAEIAGSLGSAGGIGKAGFTLAKDGVGLVSRALRLGTEGAGYGGVSGFLDGGNSLNDRLSGAGKGAAIGGLVGGAIPLVSSAAGNVAAPIISNVRARINPAGVATSQVARAIDESGRPIQDIVGDVQSAAAEGQPMYTVADAAGFPGQRLLRTVVGANGPGRSQAVDFLEQRQAGQGRRIATALSEGFGSPKTAAQAEDAIINAGRQANAPAYKAAYDAGDKPVWSDTLERLSASPTVQSAMRGAERKWADWQIIDGFGAMNPPARVENGGILKFGGGGLKTYPNLQYWDYTARDLAGKAQAARVAGNRQEAARYGNLEKLLKTELDKIVPEFKTTRSGARGFFGQETAVEQGRNAAVRGRTEDTIPAFKSLNPAEQDAYRAGYVDPLIAQVQSAPMGANKARPFTSDAFQTEAPAVAPLSTGNQMMRQIGREQRMFGTRAEATGGSKTDMNLADQSAQKVDPGLIADIATLNIAGLGRRALASATNVLHGYTPAVRQEIAKLLLARGENPGTQDVISGQMSKLARNRAIAAALMRGGTIGTASYLPRTK